MKKLLVAIPTKGRWDSIMRRTARWILNPNFKFDFKFFVEPKEWKHYEPLVGDENIVVLEKNDQGLHYAKTCIYDYVYSNDYKYVFKLDDDLKNIRVPEAIGLGVGTSIKIPDKIRVNRLNEAIEASLKAMEEIPRIVAVTFWDGGAWRKYKEGIKFPSINYRIQTNYIIDRRFFLPDVEVSTYEDFLTLINILKKGLLTTVWGECALQPDPVGRNKGGIQSFNRKEIALKEYETLKDLYPEIVWKEVNKDYEISAWDWEPDMKSTVKNILKED